MIYFRNPLLPPLWLWKWTKEINDFKSKLKKKYSLNFMENIPYSCREFSSSKGKLLQPFKIFKYSSKQTLLKWQTEDQIEGWINIIMPNFDCQYFLHVTWNIYWEINVTYIKPMLSKIIYSYGYSITYGYWISPMKMRSLWESKNTFKMLPASWFLVCFFKGLNLLLL